MITENPTPDNSTSKRNPAPPAVDYWPLVDQLAASEMDHERVFFELCAVVPCDEMHRAIQRVDDIREAKAAKIREAKELSDKLAAGDSAGPPQPSDITVPPAPEMLHKETKESQESQETRESQGNGIEKNGIYTNPSATGAQKKSPKKPTLKKPTPKSFPEWLKQAAKTAIDQAQEDQEAGRCLTPCFQFVRQLKANPELGRLTPSKVIEKIETVIRKWEKEYDVEFWPRYFYVAREDAHAEIIDAWDQIRRLPGLSALENALEFSKRISLTLHKDNFAKRPSKKFEEFLSLCGWLQITVGPGEPIAVPCREFASLLEVEPMTISRFRKWAIADGFLREVQKHKFHGPTSDNNQATSFLFAYDKWTILEQYAEGKECA